LCTAIARLFFLVTRHWALVTSLRHPQNLQGVADRGERVAQFVGQHGQKLVLAAISFGQGFLRLLDVCDVERAANIAQESSIGGEAGQARRLHPAVFSIFPP
jgi:hypothetical protein